MEAAVLPTPTAKKTPIDRPAPVSEPTFDVDDVGASVGMPLFLQWKAEPTTEEETTAPNAEAERHLESDQPEEGRPARRQAADGSSDSGGLGKWSGPFVQRRTEDEKDDEATPDQQQVDTGAADVFLRSACSTPQLLARTDDEPSVPRIPKENGQLLPAEHRQLFERTLNHSLDHVRIHTGAGADRAARQMNAEAFTVGSDIYFSEKSYSPGTAGGDRVLAHELTHVVQHDEGRVPPLASAHGAVSQPGDPLEVEAYAQEKATTRTVADLRGGEERTLPVSLAVATTAAPVISRRGTGDPDVAGGDLPAREGAVAVDPTLGGEIGDDQLIPPIPEQSSPLEQAAMAPVETSLEAVTAGGPEPAAAPARGESPPLMAQQPRGEAAASQEPVPTTERPETEFEWVTDPADFEVPQRQSEEPIAGPRPFPEIASAVPTGSNPIAELQAAALEAESHELARSLALASEQSLAAIEAQVAQLTTSVQLEAEQSRAEVTVAYTAEQEAISAELETTLSGITQSRDQEQEAIRAFVESERERLRAARQIEQESATVIAEELKGATLAAGESEAQRATTGSEERAQAILAEADAVGAGGEPASAEAQREAAHRIAQHAADKCRETGEGLASDVREEASLNTVNYDELLQDFIEKLEQAVADAETHLDEFSISALELVASRAEQALAAAQEMAGQSISALDSESSAAEEQVGAWEEQAVGLIEAAGKQLHGPLSEQTDTIRASLENYGRESAAQLRSMLEPAPRETEAAAATARQNLQEGYAGGISGLGQFDSTTATELGALFEELRANLASMVSEQTNAAAEIGGRAVQTLRETAEAAVTAMEGATSSFQEGLSAGVNDAVQEMTHGGEQFRSGAQQAHQEAISKFTQLIDDGLTSEDKLIADARSEISSAVSEIGGKYDELKSEADRRSAAEEEAPAARIHRGIWSTITSFVSDLVDSAKKWFADTFGEFWGGLLFGILAGLVIVGVGLLLAWAVGAIVAVFIVSAKVAAIVTVCILLAIAIPLSIYNRFQEFYADNPGEDAGFWRGLGLVGLGIADLTGIPYIVEGIVGQRAFAPKPMSPFEKGERLGMGIVFLGAFIVSVKNLLRARPRAAEEPAGKLPEPPKPNPAEHPPTGMSAKLQSLRGRLTDPRAVEQFDRLFDRLGGDNAKMEGIVDPWDQAGNLEQRLIDDWIKANPPPRGAALNEVPGLKARAEKLRAEIEAFREENPGVQGISDLLSRLDGEITRLNSMLKGGVEATPEGVQGTRNNVNGVDGEFRAAQAKANVTGVNRKFSLDGVPDKVEVDVVSDGGRTWIDVKRVEPFGLESRDWVGGGGKQGLNLQAQEMVRAASQNPLPNGEIPRVVFEFPLGVSPEVAAALRALGIVVRGEFRPAVVPVIPPSGDDDQ